MEEWVASRGRGLSGLSKKICRNFKGERDIEGLEARAAASVRWRQGLIPRPTETEAEPHDFGGGGGMRIQEL